MDIRDLKDAVVIGCKGNKNEEYSIQFRLRDGTLVMFNKAKLYEPFDQLADAINRLPSTQRS